MSNREVTRQVFRDAWADGRLVWAQMLATDIAYKLLAFVILTPLAGLVLRLGVSMSGETVLADQDILFFALRPAGLIVLTIVGALILTIVALEQACLMAIGVGAAEGARIGLSSALRFSLKRAKPVIGLALRLIARCLLLAAPFLVALAGAVLYLLGDHDINYYLTEKPPAFWQALGVAGVLVLGMAWVLIPRLVGWGLSLPLVLFEGVEPKQALAESRERVGRQRRSFAVVLILWGAASFLLSLTLPALVAGLGRVVAPFGKNHLNVVFAIMLILVVLWLLANLLVSWISAAGFALLVVRLYEHFGGGRGEIMSRLSEAEDLGEARSLSLSPGKILAALGAVAIVAGGIGAFLVKGVRGDNDAVVIAHRGASVAAPENTMAAVTKALEKQADLVEIDVQETADGEVVVFHDSDFMKVSGEDLKIWDAVWEQLGDIDIGSWFAPEFADERVPLLSDVLEECQGRAVVNIELKYYGHDERLEERVVEIVEEIASGAEVVAMSLKYEAVQKMRALRPDWTLGLLTTTAIGDLTELDADFLAVATGLATRSFVKRAHEQGKEVYVWTVNDPVQMFRYLNLGVDGIITDEPGIAREVIALRSELSSVERLIVGMAVLFGAAGPEPPADESSA